MSNLVWEVFIDRIIQHTLTIDSLKASQVSNWGLRAGVYHFQLVVF